MWFQAIAQLVGQEAATPVLNTSNPYAASMEQSSSPWVTIGVLVGAVALLGGAYYVLRSSR